MNPYDDLFLEGTGLVLHYKSTKTITSPSGRVLMLMDSVCLECLSSFSWLPLIDLHFQTSKGQD